MTPYYKDTPCIKCGNLGADTKYLSQGTTNFIWKGLPLTPPAMLRTCFRCKYEWHETPMDFNGVSQDIIDNVEDYEANRRAAFDEIFKGDA